VLRSKHPPLQEPTGIGEDSFEPYGNLPNPVYVDITAQMIETVAPRLSGSAGPGGVDSVDLQNWLLRFGKESLALQEEIAEWASWLANASPPWAAYRVQYADFEEAQEEAIPCHSRRGIKRESIMTHS
jgi:hypothetical protein